MPEEELLTRNEWRVREAKEECSNFGHDWEIVYRGFNIPVYMFCTRPCGGPKFDFVKRED